MVHPHTFRFTFENGTSLTCAVDLGELDALVDDQVRAHHIATAQFLARKYRWRVVQCTPGAPGVDRAIVMRPPPGDRRYARVYARVL